MPESSRSRLIGALFFCAAIVYAVMMLVTLPALEQASGGLRPFDLRPAGYTYSDATELLSALGPEGRHAYLTRQIPLDLLYPGLLGAALWLSLRALSRGLPGPRIWAILTLTAPVAALADYAENALVAGLLLSSSAPAPALVFAASTATQVKSVATTLAVAAMFAALAIRGARRIARSRRNR